MKPSVQETEFRGARFQFDIAVSILAEGRYTACCQTVYSLLPNGIQPVAKRYTACCQKSLHTTGKILNIHRQVTLL
jgi:hypothetical protein